MSAGAIDAGAHAARVSEVRATIGVFKAWELERFDDDDVIRPGAVVTLEVDGDTCQRYLLALVGGGLNIEMGGETVRVITPGSPIGGELVGARVGDDFELELAGTLTGFEIVDLA